MALLNTVQSNIVDEKVKHLYQPEFPLKMDNLHGPYRPITNLETSLAKDFENLLLTSPGEWPMNPDIGVGIKRYLFENYDSPELTRLRPRIEQQIQRYLPNLQLVEVKFVAPDQDKDNNRVKIQIAFAILGSFLWTVQAVLDHLNQVKFEDLSRQVSSLGGLGPRTRSLASSIQNI